MASFPTIDGAYRLSADWEIALPGEFQRRFDDTTLVLWRPGLTARLDIRMNDRDEPKEVRVRRVQEGRPAGALDVTTETNGALIRYAFRVREAGGGDVSRSTLHGVVVGNSGLVELTVSFDVESNLATAQGLWRGLREVEAPTGSCS
jgi:hypothetical protein